MKLYICNICGNLIEMIDDSGAVPSCCGAEMEEVTPGSTDGAEEKHVPMFEVTEHKDRDCKYKVVHVHVGEKPHPMADNHYIDWIAVETDKGSYRKYTQGKKEAKACFYIKKEEEITAIYAYCNIHGLWVHWC